LLEERLPLGAPGFLCPRCQCLLEYVGSRDTSGRQQPDDVSDYYTCPAGCGTYERDRATHRLRGF
jgi:hypothetical protein